MTFFRLVWMYMKRLFGLSALFNFLFPIGMTLMIVFMTGDPSGQAVGVVNEDRGDFGGQLLATYDGKTKTFNTYEEGLEALKARDVEMLYRLPEDFSISISSGRTPSISVIDRNDGAGSEGFELFLREETAFKSMVAFLEKKGIPINDHSVVATKILRESPMSDKGILPILMLTMYALMGGALLGSDLIGLKSSRVLGRGLSTPTSGRIVIGSIAFGAFLLQTIQNLLALLVMVVILDLNQSILGMAIGLITCSCVLAVGLQLFLMRLFKKPELGSMVGMAVVMFLIFIGVFGMDKSIIQGISPMLWNITYLSPFYWVITALDTGNLFQSMGILLLMSGVLFTAGTLKVKAFALE